MLRHIRLLVLDLDYIVFDCARLKIESLRRSLISLAEAIPHDIRLPDAQDAEEGFIEHGFRWTQFLDIGLDEGRMDELQQAYRIHESRLIEAGLGHIYSGIQEFFQGCKSAGLSLALGAEARREYLMAVSDRYELDRFFDLALCTEEYGSGMADEMLDEMMQRLEVNPSETVVLGVRPSLFRAAQNIDIITVGCGWGTHRGELLAAADLQSPSMRHLRPTLLRADELAARHIN